MKKYKIKMSFIVCRFIGDINYSLKYYLVSIKVQMSIKIKFWLKIRELRKLKKISQEQLASKAKLHRTYISDIERWVKNVSLENIEKIGLALEVNLSDLFL